MAREVIEMTAAEKESEQCMMNLIWNALEFSTIFHWEDDGFCSAKINPKKKVLE